MKKYSVLFVCTGNICRSPTADGVLRQLVASSQMNGKVEVDSAGTQDYHTGQAPDLRAQQHAKRRGYDLSMLRARQLESEDFRCHDLILAMDRSHLAALNRLCPAEYKSKVGLFLEYARNTTFSEVPDPYYGGAEGFEQVLDLIEDASAGLMEFLRQRVHTAQTLPLAG